MNIPCPFGHLSSVIIVADHCVMASDDPEATFACHEQGCRYHQPTTLEEWREVVRNAPPESAPYYWLSPDQLPDQFYRNAVKPGFSGSTGATNFCPKCGSNVGASDSFCRNCGGKL